MIKGRSGKVGNAPIGGIFGTNSSEHEIDYKQVKKIKYKNDDEKGYGDFLE